MLMYFFYCVVRTMRQNQFAVDNRRDWSNLYRHPETTARYTKQKKKPITESSR